MGKFLPGQSGNPGGRPRKDRDLVAQAQEEGPNSIRTLVELRDRRKTPAAVRVRACEVLLDRGFGKPTVTVEHRDYRDVADYTDDELRAVIAERSTGSAGIAAAPRGEGKPH